MVYVVALTGGIGSGKSTIADAFSQHNITVVDADIIARQIVEPGSAALQAIVGHFGQKVLLADKSLNRAALREHIFNNMADKTWLNQLLHPLIQQETQRQLAQSQSPYALWVVPLLVENALESLANRILVVDATEETQLMRTMARDGLTRQQAQKIIDTQATRAQRLAIADDIIDNNGSPETIKPLVAKLHQHYLFLAHTASQ